MHDQKFGPQFTDFMFVNIKGLNFTLKVEKYHHIHFPTHRQLLCMYMEDTEYSIFFISKSKLIGLMGKDSCIPYKNLYKNQSSEGMLKLGSDLHVTDYTGKKNC